MKSIKQNNQSVNLTFCPSIDFTSLWALPSLKTYKCYIKSHCEAPDFEIEVEAFDQDEAVDMLINKYDLDREIVKNSIIQI